MDLYTFYSKRAEDATLDAEYGYCRAKWIVAAHKWDVAMKHSTCSKFAQDIKRALFVGRFENWLRRRKPLCHTEP